MKQRGFLGLLLALALLLGCAAPLAGCSVFGGATPVVIDTDPGVDDALALLFAAGSDKLDIRGITTVQGSVNGARTAFNALSLASYLGLGCPVARGADLPLERAAIDASAENGDDGLGGLSLPLPTRDFDSRSAAQLMYDMAAEADGELWLIALGPLTNVATAFEAFPDLPGMLAGIVLMGGSTEGGNASAYGEFNIFNDPEAAAIVFSSGVSITMVGLNAAQQTYIMAGQLEAMAAAGGGAAEMLAFYADYMTYDSYERGGRTLGDLLAVACLVDSAVGSGYRAAVTINAAAGDHRGQTTAIAAEAGNVTVIDKVDSKRLLELMTKTFETYEPLATAGGLAPLAKAAFVPEELGYLAVAGDYPLPVEGDSEFSLKLVYQDTQSGILNLLLEQTAPADGYATPDESPTIELRCEQQRYAFEPGFVAYERYDARSDSYVVFHQYSWQPDAGELVEPLDGAITIVADGSAVALPNAARPTGYFSVPVAMGQNGQTAHVAMVPFDERGEFWLCIESEEYSSGTNVKALSAVGQSGRRYGAERLTMSATGLVFHYLFQFPLEDNDRLGRLEYSGFESSYMSAYGSEIELEAGESIEVDGLGLYIEEVETDDAGAVTSVSYRPDTAEGRVSAVSLFFSDGSFLRSALGERQIDVVDPGEADGDSQLIFIIVYIDRTSLGYIDFTDAKW